MKTIKNLALFYLLIYMFSTPVFSQSKVSIATWRNNSKGALTIDSDDYPYWQWRGAKPGYMVKIGWPELKKRGIPLTTAVTGANCDSVDWQLIEEATRLYGFDPINHGFHHYDLLDKNDSIIKKYCHIKPVFSLAVFKGGPDEPRFTTTQLGYIGAVSILVEGNKDLNDKNLTDLFAVKANLYKIGYWKYRVYTEEYIDRIISTGNWGLLIMHELVRYIWEPMLVEDFIRLLDYCVEKRARGDLWISTVTEVGRYIKLRQNTFVAVSKETLQDLEINITVGNYLDSALFQTKLTYIIELPENFKKINVSQENIDLPFRFTSTNTILVDASPYKGNILVTKQGDKTPPPPGAPSDLNTSSISATEIDLSWTDNSNDESGFVIERKCATDSSYLPVVRIESNTTNYQNTSLLPSTNYFYRVAAYNSYSTSLYCNEKYQMTKDLQLNDPAPVKNVSGGLKYEYYEGSFKLIPDFDQLKPLKTGVIENFDIVKNRMRKNDYGFRFSGYIKVPGSGEYTFYTQSDDGSILYIDGKEIVYNDGSYDMQQRRGRVGLKAGLHNITVMHNVCWERIWNWNTDGSEFLEVKWEGPGILLQVVPDNVLFHREGNKKDRITKK